MNGMFATQVVITGPSPGLPPGVKKPIPPGLVKEREKRRLQQGNSIVVGDKDDWLSVSR
jgi:hypothetical protein